MDKMYVVFVSILIGILFFIYIEVIIFKKFIFYYLMKFTNLVIEEKWRTVTKKGQLFTGNSDTGNHLIPEWLDQNKLRRFGKYMMKNFTR